MAEPTRKLSGWRFDVNDVFGSLDMLGAQLQREIWRANDDAPLPVRAVRSLAQLVALTARGFRADQLLLRASALTYVTALSLIPLLGVIFAIIRLVGSDQTLVSFAIDQLTTVAPDARETIRGYVDNLDFARFGAVGGTLVFGMAIFALRHLEKTLNDIWGVPSSRSWARRFSDYLAVLVVAPISTGLAVSLGTSLESDPIVSSLLAHPVLARVHELGLSHLPVFFLFFGFTFLYWFFPNTSVQIRAAALGGAIAAVLFSGAQAIYVDFQIGAAKYEVVFGALSAVPLILAWLYVCWAIVLLGAEIAFAAQNLPYARREMRVGEATPAEREAVALELAVAIARAFSLGEQPPTAERLADRLDEPVRRLRRLIDEFEGAGLVRSVQALDGEDVGFVPAAPLADLTIADFLGAVRGDVSGETNRFGSRSSSVARLLDRLEGAWNEIAEETTLASLVREAGDEGAAREAKHNVEPAEIAASKPV